MDLTFALACVLAGVGAGAVVAAIGAGSLVSFPMLLAVGLPPVQANVCNCVGLVPGGVSASLGFRHVLAGRRRLVIWVAGTSAAGALVGAVLLLVLPSSTFERVAGPIVLFAATLVAVQPLVARWVHGRGADAQDGAESRDLSWGLRLAATVVGGYGGYFGAGQGVMLVAFLATALRIPLVVVNGLKNVAVLAANLAGAVVFVAIGPVRWDVVLLMAVGSFVGGWIGAIVGRALPPIVFRVLVVLFGWVVGLRLLLVS